MIEILRRSATVQKIIRPTSERIRALLQYFIYFTADFYRQIIIET